MKDLNYATNYAYVDFSNMINGRSVVMDKDDNIFENRMGFIEKEKESSEYWTKTEYDADVETSSNKKLHD